jgi:spore germination protein GerM
VAYVDFSKEIQTKHWGGSSGEAMTIFSVVNSLARLPGVEKVQFLVEGKVQESLVGHADTTQPIAPNWNLVKKQS